MKKECFVKSLKSDYTSLGKAMLVIIVVAASIYLGYMNWGAVESVLSGISAIGVFIICELIAMLVIPLLLILVEDKDDFKGNENTPVLACLSSFIMGVVYVLYSMSSCSVVSTGSDMFACAYPDVLLIFIGLLLVNILLVSPITIAYMRCREKL